MPRRTEAGGAAGRAGRGIFDKETRRKPLAFAADAAAMGIPSKFGTPGHGRLCRRLRELPPSFGEQTGSNELYTIIGVTEKGFTGVEPGTATDIWVPTMMNRLVDQSNGPRVVRRARSFGRATTTGNRHSYRDGCASNRYRSPSGRGSFRDGVSWSGDWSHVELGFGTIRSNTAV